MTIYILTQEDQNQHGYIDTTIIAAYPSNAEAWRVLRELAEADVRAGKLVCGFEDRWPVDKRGNGAGEADWEVSFDVVETVLEGPTGQALTESEHATFEGLDATIEKLRRPGVFVDALSLALELEGLSARLETAVRGRRAGLTGSVV